MGIHRLESNQLLPIDLDTAWEFFSDPRNLAEITPPSLGFVVKSEVPPVTYAGLILTYTVRPLLGIPVNWVTEITHVDPRRMFVDEQRFGPYRFWHHQHHFREVEGGVEMRDIVHYAVPMGIAGDIIARAIVAPKLATIFEYRTGILKAHFGPITETSGAVPVQQVGTAGVASHEPRGSRSEAARLLKLASGKNSD